MNTLFRTRAYERRMVWGGRRLGPGIGETLEASGLEEMPSWLEGCDEPLPRLFEARRDEFLGPGFPVLARFPLLVKRLDAAQKLSVQVHPDDGTARELEGEPNGKCEAWVILDADPGAAVYLGFQPGVGEADIAAALKAGAVLELLRRIPVTRGDVLPVPPGCVHAIGEGVFLFEVQQPSDLTYRLYDYDRPGDRDLHIEKGLRAMKLDRRPSKTAWPVLSGPGVVTLCDMGPFRIDHWTVAGRLEAKGEGLRVLHAAEGGVRLEAATGQTEILGPGETLVAAAAAGALAAEGEGPARVLAAIHQSAPPS